MTFLRSVGQDLVDKRLWPFAVALVIALVTVPVLLGRSSAPEQDAVAPTPVTAAQASISGASGSAAPGQAVVSFDQPVAGGARYRGGPVRNPFVQHHLPKPLDVPAIAPAAGGSGSTGDAKGGASPASGAADVVISSPGSSGSGSSGSTAPASDPLPGATPPSPSAPSPSPSPSPRTNTGVKRTTKPASDGHSDDFYRVSLSFGETGAQRTIKDVARLTALPSSSDPFFVFLGVLEDGKTAVFLVTSEADAQAAPGACKPRLTDCQTIQLKAGDQATFDLSTGTAGVIQYHLNLLSLSRRTAATAAVASTRRTRESKAGRAILRDAVKQTDVGFDFIPRLGVLTPAKHDDVKDGDHGYLPASVLQGSMPGIEPVTEVPAPAPTATDAPPTAGPIDDGSGYMPAQPVPDPAPAPVAP